jgi:hypothetical protein
MAQRIALSTVTSISSSELGGYSSPCRIVLWLRDHVMVKITACDRHGLECLGQDQDQLSKVIFYFRPCRHFPSCYSINHGHTVSRHLIKHFNDHYSQSIADLSNQNGKAFTFVMAVAVVIIDGVRFSRAYTSSNSTVRHLYCRVRRRRAFVALCVDPE